jgi:hypothetical protein
MKGPSEDGDATMKEIKLGIYRRNGEERGEAESSELTQPRTNLPRKRVPRFIWCPAHQNPAHQYLPPRAGCPNPHRHPT